MNTAKCPTCNAWILNVHFEEHEPSVFKGGSIVYTATIFPCGHAIGAVPATWEAILNSIQKQTNGFSERLNNIEISLSQIIYSLNNLQK